MDKEIQIGCIGLRDTPWSDEFFPHDLPPEWTLDYYANEFRLLALDTRELQIFHPEILDYDEPLCIVALLSAEQKPYWQKQFQNCNDSVTMRFIDPEQAQKQVGIPRMERYQDEKNTVFLLDSNGMRASHLKEVLLYCAQHSQQQRIDLLLQPHAQSIEHARNLITITQLL